MSFFKHLGHALGGVVHAVTAPVTAGAGLVAKASAHIPIIGKPIHSIMNGAILAPFHTLDNIAKGARIDKALVGQFKEQVKSVKDVAPYAQAVISFVPGLGMAANTAISAGLSLADGKKLTSAVTGAIRDNLPAQVRGVYDKAQAVVASAGDHPEAAINAAIAKLPSETDRKAFVTGVAVAVGQKAQGIAHQAAVSSYGSLATEGQTLAAADPVLSSGTYVLTNPQALQGYRIGVAVMKHHTPPMFYNAIFRNMDEDSKLGFSMAIACVVGMNEYHAPVSLQAPREQFGYYVSCGLGNVDSKQRSKILSLLAHDNSARIGVDAANAVLKAKPWWHRLLVKLHLRKDEPEKKAA